MEHGYALVNPDTQIAESWHPTFDDAELRQKWERRVMGRLFVIKKNSEAIWPAWTAWGTYAG